MAPRKALILLIDSSASMDEPLGETRKIENVCKAILNLLSNSDRFSEDDLISLMFFHATKSGDVPKVDVLIPLMMFSDLKTRLEHIRKKVEKVKPIGGTPIGFGLSSAIEALSKSEVEVKKIILLTDGENNVGIPPEEAILEAKRHGVRVDVIGIGDEINPIELEAVAEQTGGSFKRYPSNGSMLSLLEELVGRPMIHAVKPAISERNELSKLLQEYNAIEDEIALMVRKLNEGKVTVDEYAQRASELEFRKKDFLTRVREIRSALSKKLISAQIRLANLDQKSLEAQELKLYIEELRKLLEESEIE